jgi:serine/threonine protein kinase/tetratricopeptide (TPR) repeat protein
MRIWNTKANAVFLEAVEMASPEQRLALLDEASRGDPALRAEVEQLLEAYCRAGQFLEHPATLPTAAVESSAPGTTPGAIIGPYKLLERIGEGGMGEVWMAEQREPMQRQVAMKIIKAGMDTRSVVTRFEAERQALALMDHPNIAKVFEAGATDSGLPYFVMELVKGTPITTYCDQHRLTLQDRLELFVPVCQAIQHAHQKGIIHCDIKPLNVLITPYDGRPVPKIIDFGVAKAIDQRLTERTLYTGFGVVVGMLEYMSPEQAELNNQDIDTRSDIYALGVLLYELLTGTTPLSHERLTQAAFTEMLRAVREEEPPKPSTRLSDSKETLVSIAEQRQIEPAKLPKLVQGELDWIVMKALEKDRTRRYETANGLARDIENYLQDEPVQACPPSVWYRLGKFARRNKAALAVVGLVLFCLTVLLAGGGWVLRDRAARRQETARQARESLTRARQWSGENKLALARQELAAIKTRVGSDRAAHGALAVEVEAYDAELGRLEHFLDLVDQAHEAEFPQPVALVLQASSAGGKPAPPRESSPERQPAQAVPFVLQALSCYGVLERDDWSVRLEGGLLDPDQVAQVRRTAYEQLLWLANDATRRQVDHRSSQKLSSHEAAEAGLAYLRQAEAASRATSAFYLVRARCHEALGKPAEARRDDDLARQTPGAIALDHYLLALAAFDARNKAEAVNQCEAALRVERTHYWSMYLLGQSLVRLGQPELDFAQAAVAFTGCSLKRPEHAAPYLGRARAYGGLGRPKEAESESREALRLRPDPRAHYQLAQALYLQGKHAEAEAVCREAIRLHPDSPDCYYMLQWVLRAQDKLAAAVRFYVEASAAHPELADDLRYTNRYGAACKAALLGCGWGQDAAKLDETERARLRKQALSWLREELAAGFQLLEKQPEKVRAHAGITWGYGLSDPDFEGVRGAALTKLPEAERRAWQELWKDVGQLRANLEQPARPTAGVKGREISQPGREGQARVAAGTPVRWLGYSLGDNSVPLMDEVKSYVNVLWLYDWRFHGEASIRAARERGFKVILCVATREEMDTFRKVGFEYARRNREAVIAVVSICPDYWSIIPIDLVRFARDVKRELPGVEYWVSMAFGGIFNYPVPPEADTLAVECLWWTPGEVRSASDRFIPRWIEIANSRPVVLIPNHDWDRTVSPGTFRAYGQVVTDYNLAGAIFVVYGDETFKGKVYRGFRERAELVDEVKQIANQWGTVRLSPSASKPASQTK